MPRYPRRVTTTTPRQRATAARPAKRGRETPILVRQLRDGIEESVHRGDIVEADASGRIIRQLGDPDRVVTLRSTVKPFGVVALIEAGGIEAFDLEPAEIAIMASSHSGEDIHVRTLQAMFRRAGVSQALLACGNEGMPLDPLTAARLARDGEKCRSGPPHVLRAARRLAAAVAAQGLGPGDVLAADAPVAGRLPSRSRPRVRHARPNGCARRSMAAVSRPTPSGCARSPRRTRCWPIRRASRRATRAASWPPRSASCATRCWPIPRWSPAATTGSTPR